MKDECKQRGFSNYLCRDHVHGNPDCTPETETNSDHSVLVQQWKDEKIPAGVPRVAPPTQGLVPANQVLMCGNRRGLPRQMAC
ncbi:hypothetical protein PAMP_016654 [Pampus punctatissimus]